MHHDLTNEKLIVFIKIRKKSNGWERMAPELSGKCAGRDEGAQKAVIVRWAGDGSGYLDGLRVLLGSFRSSVSISSASFRR